MLLICTFTRGSLFLNFRSIGVTQGGAFAEYVVVHKTHVYNIENLSFDEATFIEPLSCAVHGIKLLDITPGAEVLIFGAGPAGLTLLQLAKHSGSSLVVIADPNPSKLDKAKELGANFAVLADRTNHIKNRKTLTITGLGVC